MFYYSSGNGDEDVDPIASCDSKLFTCATKDAFLFSKARHLFLNRVTYENEKVSFYLVHKFLNWGVMISCFIIDSKFIPHKPICPFSFLECPYILFSFVGSPAPISKWIHYIYSKRRTIILVTKINIMELENIKENVFTLFFIFLRIFFSDFSSFLERGNLCGTG